MVRYLATSTKSVAERWPKLTVLELAEGQNEINGNIYAANVRLCEALEEVIARLETLEANQPGSSKPKKAAAQNKKLKDAKRYVKGIGGKQPPGCGVPGDLGQ